MEDLETAGDFGMMRSQWDLDTEKMRREDMKNLDGASKAV